MKRGMALFALLGVFFAMKGTLQSQIYTEKMIVVVTASYNNKDWYEKNLMSIFSQKYVNYHVIYIDDCSTDGTADLVEKWTKDHGVSDRITLIRNTVNQGGLANHYMALQLIPDRAIVCVIDGDDWLAENFVFDFLNKQYQENDMWMSYGQFISWPDGVKGWCCEIPLAGVDQYAYRKHSHNLSHLRTFYAGLFKQIKKEDLMNEGCFWSINDNPVMFPMAEMAKGHVKFFPQVLCVWNNENPLNDHKETALGRSEQLNTDKMIRALPPYNPISTPFKDSLDGTLAELKQNIDSFLSQREL